MDPSGHIMTAEVSTEGRSRFPRGGLIVGRPGIAHLVTPYLPPTAPWIHTQLRKARKTRPVVFTRWLFRPEAFPFEPVHCVCSGATRQRLLLNRLRMLTGAYDPLLFLPGIRAENCQLIHAHNGWEGARAVSVAAAAGLPLVVSFYGRDASRLPRFPWWRLWYRRLFRRASAFVVEGPNLARRLVDLGAPRERVHVIHLGVEIDRILWRRPSEKPTDAVEILVSASMRPKKGIPSAVKAFAAVARRFPEVRMRILGDGPQRRLVERLVESLGLRGRVFLEGYVPYKRHLEALGQAHIFLAPSRTAADGDSEGGAPVALIEAQAAGLPVVSTLHADIPEVVEHGRSGLLSPEYDDEALARNLYWMLSNRSQWDRFAEAARERMEREFDAAKQVSKTEDLYLQLIGSREA